MLPWKRSHDKPADAARRVDLCSAGTCADTWNIPLTNGRAGLSSTTTIDGSAPIAGPGGVAEPVRRPPGGRPRQCRRAVGGGETASGLAAVRPTRVMEGGGRQGNPATLRLHAPAAATAYLQVHEWRAAAPRTVGTVCPPVPTVRRADR